MDHRRKAGVVGSIVHDDTMPTLEVWIALKKSRERLDLVFTGDKARSVWTECGETGLLADERVLRPIDGRVADLHKSGLREFSSVGL